MCGPTAGHPVVWLEVPIELSQFIAPATAAGFIFHHSTERTLTLLYTFEPEAMVPSYATHYIGAGGVVFNDNRRTAGRERMAPARPQPALLQAAWRRAACPAST